jgi:NADH-quinone oxidoreductase subunit L
MIRPLQVLMVGTILAGLVGIPAMLGELPAKMGLPFHFPNVFERFLEPVFEPAHEALAEVFSKAPPSHAMEFMLMVLSVGVGLLGIFIAKVAFERRGRLLDPIEGASRGLYRVLYNKYYVDEIYGAVFVRGLALGGGDGLHAVDRFIIDGGDGDIRPGLGVNGIAWATRDVVAAFSNAWDRYVVDGLVNLAAAILDNLSYVFRAVQNGLVQHYALAMLIAVLFMIGVGSRFVL